MQAPYFIKGKIHDGYRTVTAILLDTKWPSLGEPATGLFLIENKLVHYKLGAFETDGHVA